MILDQPHESAPSQRSHLAPPVGPLTAVKSVFWNEQELRAGWRLALFALFVFLLTAGESELIAVLHVPRMAPSNFTVASTLIQESARFLVVLAATGIMGFLERRPIGSYGLPRAAAFRARFWQGAAWGIAMITAMILLISAFGGFSFGGLALRGLELWRYALAWGVAFLFVGFFEEYLFRGYAQFTLAAGVGFWPAASVLSASFGAIHLRNTGEDIAGALGVFTVAMFFCFTLRRTGSLWFAVGLHAAFDWGETFLYSVPDSGLVAPGHLLNSSLHGPAWLTGGTVGPEASVMSFLVIALAAVLFALVYPSETSKDLP